MAPVREGFGAIWVISLPSFASFAEGEKIRLPLVSAIAEPVQAVWQRFFA
jgi:hypothetical protein